MKLFVFGIILNSIAQRKYGEEEHIKFFTNTQCSLYDLINVHYTYSTWKKISNS